MLATQTLNDMVKIFIKGLVPLEVRLAPRVVLLSRVWLVLPVLVEVLTHRKNGNASATMSTEISA